MRSWRLGGFGGVRDPSWRRDGIKPSLGGRVVAGALGISVLAVCAGIAAAKSTQLAEILIAGLLLCLYIGYATSNMRGAVVVMFASLSLIPVYAVPTFRAFYPYPTAIAALIVALLLVRVGGRWRITVVDLTFAATCGALLLAASLGPHSLLATLSELCLWVPPYLAGRAICRRRDGVKTFALAAAVAGLVTLPFILYETLTKKNIFFPFARPGTELTLLWAKPDFRPGGLLRSQGAFGHPLSMALIVGSCAIFAFALALQAASLRGRVAWLLASLGLVIGQYTSHERSGWFVVIGGLLLFAAIAIPRATRIRYAVAVLLVAVPLTFVAASATHPANGEASVARTESTADRENLWRHAFEPGALGILGLSETKSFNHFVNAVNPGRTAIDSAYLQVADIYGLIAFAVLFTVVAAVAWVAVAVRGTWAGVVPAVALADLLILTVVGFQTQLPIFVWLMVGAVSGVDLRRRSRGNQSSPVGRA
jgi:hypothetical protein